MATTTVGGNAGIHLDDARASVVRTTTRHVRVRRSVLACIAGWFSSLWGLHVDIRVKPGIRRNAATDFEDMRIGV